MSPLKTIKVLERRADFLAKKIAHEDPARPPLTFEREELKALRSAIVSLEKEVEPPSMEREAMV